MNSTDTEFISILDASDASGQPSVVRDSAKAIPEILPILGLSDIIIFPGMVAPLLVETASSIRLIDDVVGGDRFIGLVLQKQPDAAEPKPEDLWGHGCVGRVLKMLKFPDNTVRVLVEGLRRIEIVKYESEDPYLRARVKVNKDTLESSIEMTALTRNAHAQFQQIIGISPTMSEQVKVAAHNADEPDKLSDLIAANLNLSLEERQDLIASHDVKLRLSKLLPLLARELEVATLTSKIQKDVSTTLSKSQRDYFLREQLRAIQRELGETDSALGEINTLRDQIDKAALPEEVCKAALKELDRLQQTPVAAAEYSIIRNYLDWIIHLPWNRVTKDELDLQAAEQLLNEQHHGLQKVKDRLLEFLAVIKLKQKLRGPILCLVGPPGVGKTSLGRSVAEALGRKFVRISLGGMRDEAEIRGHRRTYVGAMPGRILQSLRRVESANPVILLDELDKVGNDFRGDPASALLEVLDPEQNQSFTDHYLDLPFDLSRVLFIATANWLDPVPPALRDRLEVIELPSYTLAEKVQIAKRHLLPRQLEEHGLKKKLVRLPDASLQKLIEQYTRESGVRQLERELAALTRKAARRIANSDTERPVVIAASALADYLGSPRFISETDEAITDCGIAKGLAWTPVGGEILFIEATRMTGTGKLILTGSLGEVMKESAQTALSYLRSHAKLLAINAEDFDKSDIHVHVPAGATPKDGPSAGVTIAVALTSLLTGRQVGSNIAMTGEISLRGRVLAVGGVKEKVLAAHRSGIKQVLLPEANRKDWEEVPADVRRRLKAHFVRHIADLFPIALCRK